MTQITVIVPVYNVEKYLRQCLDSIINQTFKDIEIICVNDCTPDNSQLILDEYAKKDSRIKLLKNEQNMGLGRTRNIALNFVNSPYIFFVDSDDWLEENALEELYNAITETDSNLAYANFRDIHENKIIEKNLKNILQERNIVIEDKKIFTNIDIRKACFRKVPNFSWYKLYKKEFLDKNNIRFASYKYEDQIFSIKAKLLSERNVYVDKVLYNYRIQNESIMRTSKVPYLDIYNDINNLLIELNLKEELKEEFDTYVESIFTMTIKKLKFIEKIKLYNQVKKLLTKKQIYLIRKKLIKYLLKDILKFYKKKKIYK